MGIEVEELGYTSEDDRATPGMIPVAGRGMVAGRVWLRPDAAGLVIRVDDDERPEFWCEMVLTAETLRRMLAKVERMGYPGTRAPNPE